MNDRWKDIFIMLTLGGLALLSMITIVELFLVKTLELDGNTTVSFIGAILGGLLSGYITLLGVNKTLKHRDREIFLNNYSEKLMIMDEFEETYSKYLNSVFIIEQLNKSSKNDIGAEELLYIVVSIYDQLVKDRDKIYKVLDYNDSIDILNFYKKSLRTFKYKKNIPKEEVDNCIDKIRRIYEVFNVSKSQLENRYREYKKELINS